MRYFFFFLSVLLFFSFTWENSRFETGLNAYDNRAIGHKGYEADREIIDKALTNFLAAYEEVPTAEAAEYILRSYYFKGNFTCNSKEERFEVFKEGKDFGLSAIEKFPNDADLLYYHAITYGKWGEHVGLWGGLKDNAADKLKGYFERVIELDPKAVEGGGHRILAVLHYQIPYIPFVVSWPSSEEAEKNLKQALAYFPDNLSNNFFYAEFLEKEGRNEEALNYARKIINGSPRSTFLVEDTWAILQAKEMLERIAE